MRRSSRLLTALVVAVIFVSSSAVLRPAFGQDMSDQDKKMMEMMAKYGTPGEAHELLKRYVGEWEFEMRSWPKPGAEPMVSVGTMKNTLLFDGRYVKCLFKGMMGDPKAMGIEILGYDLYQERYVTFWIDSWSTSFALTSGTLDGAGRVLTETGAFPDPMTEGKTMQKVKNVTSFLPEGGYRFEMFMVMPDGTEVKSMEIVTTKKTA